MPRGSPTVAQLRDEIDELREENELLQAREKALKMLLSAPLQADDVSEDVDDDEDDEDDEDE
jgi:hypothetical protein